MRERERERVRKRERCRIWLFLFLKGMMGALAPFSYKVINKNMVSEIKCSANKQMNYGATSKCFTILQRWIGPIFIGLRSGSG